MFYFNLWTQEVSKYKYFYSVKNTYGGYAFSPVVNVNIKYNCKYDEATYRDSPWGALDEYDELYIDSLGMLNLNVTIGQRDFVEADLNFLINNNASMYCPRSQYRITKVVEKNSSREIPLAQYKDVISITSEGIFTFRQNKIPFEYLVYFETFNTYKWFSPTLPGMDVNNTYVPKPFPPQRPTFKYEPDSGWDYHNGYLK